MNNSKIVIIDTSISNVFNVRRAFMYFGQKTIISSDKDDVLSASKVILPGVGAFSKAMESLEKHDLIDIIKEVAENGTPILGICLGMQILMTRSNEDGDHLGLDLIQGSVKKFDNTNQNNKFKIPHYGWSEVFKPSSNKLDSWNNTILEDLDKESLFCYFVHSYFANTDNPNHTIAQTSYGGSTFSSVIKNKNIMGCQFHPEKSSIGGLTIIENFIKI